MNSIEPVISTRDLIVKTLDEIKPDCQECMYMVAIYRDRINMVSEKEHRLNAVDPNSETANRRAITLQHAVKLEATCARRFVLHLMTHL